MPPPTKPAIPKAAEPKYGRNFDPWNSVALGHQRAETKGPQGWRDNRTWKLQNQLEGGHSGGDRLSDRVGHGSEDFDEERQILIPKEVRARATNSVMDMLRKPGTMSQSSSRQASRSPEKQLSKEREEKEQDEDSRGAADEKPVNSLHQHEGGHGEAAPNAEGQSSSSSSSSTSSSKIFDGLVIYVNGSTHPLISDHKLKHLLAQNGARMSIHLGRRQVTHVILGKPSGPNGGAGGGLAGGKLEKEIRRVGGCGVKYVGVEWVLESVRAGRRLPETRFANLKVASKGQPSVYGTFSKSSS
ncbi:hypothetical protein N8I77_002613 [Diaporthe amygdali]|uniref:BRCT domain-containing protein n=1 Tax=Phomopsis amygdali TaxID=1214568 RepID=A0AAD9SV61_PHOAM|nr:hypothetical protein N8I77_002613 [Diaporthe amygdali]